MSHAAGEDEINGAGEVVAVFDEERAFFRKENFEALVDRDLRLVGFDLAEVGVDGGIENEAVAQDVLGIDSALGLKGAAGEEGIRRISPIDVAVAAQQSIGNELKVVRGDVIDSARDGRLVEAALNAVG